MPCALLSVYDKTGIVEFARELHSLGWKLLSSGGTAGALADAGIPATDVAAVTGYPAILGHRVVTLHPAVHGGLLADIDDPSHRDDLAAHGIEPIALAVVNLYPFESKPSIDLIDVGGPAMVRAAAKNHRHVAVVTEPAQYAEVLGELRRDGAISFATRHALAARAFAHTASYDISVAAWFAAADTVASNAVASNTVPVAEQLPERITLQLEREATLRYGENPHQHGARYRVVGERSWWSSAEQLGGKEMSYLNVYDADAAWSLVHRFTEPAAVVIKHGNPCGVAVASNIETAYRRAHECDPVSAFGGIVGLNRTMTAATADALGEVFTEVVIAPDFEPQALEVLARKKNLRVLRAVAPLRDGRSIRSIDGGVLVQDHDTPSPDTSRWRVVSRVQPTAAQLRDAALAWVTCAAVSSNAIVLVNDSRAVAIGGGQQNRVDAARIACTRAAQRAVGAVAASDAFFPFRDGPDVLAAAGVVAIVQPGGSLRDEESIAAADEHGIAMIFTGVRHFRH
ncbi:MAG: bifunctional phosphoribosylaminoimidazolecarboxamide formyltransferase/IMP cyclohydrolase PurH [Actinobacteria bacterium]|nr:bifunctional phosphoribosylaminoimidazolecarboxamide formyltransferase/IMP cyclohydrolase PurH [Actinomycetota bacterium]